MSPKILPPCRFCRDPAVVRVGLPAGCVVYPEDREQDLCEHHWHKTTPLAGAYLVAFLLPRADGSGWDG